MQGKERKIFFMYTPALLSGWLVSVVLRNGCLCQFRSTLEPCLNV